LDEKVRFGSPALEFVSSIEADIELVACTVSILLLFSVIQATTRPSQIRCRPFFIQGDIMRTTIMLIVVAAILFFVCGCGPGQPFEI